MGHAELDACRAQPHISKTLTAVTDGAVTFSKRNVYTGSAVTAAMVCVCPAGLQAEMPQGDLQE
jgi:hypothetical protein